MLPHPLKPHPYRCKVHAKQELNSQMFKFPVYCQSFKIKTAEIIFRRSNYFFSNGFKLIYSISSFNSFRSNSRVHAVALSVFFICFNQQPTTAGARCWEAVFSRKKNHNQGNSHNHRKVFPFLSFVRSISPPSLGQVTPIRSTHRSVCLQSGLLVQPIYRP